MIFTETKLKGAFVIDLEPKHDQRGFFARTFCAKEFEARGLDSAIAQCNLSYNTQKGTLRGMHYQIPPVSETKVVSCVRGAIYDVIIDLRPDSPTYRDYIAVELSAENRRALYIPELFAHGFQTLTDDAEVLYQMGEFYTPGYDRGIRYDDPEFAIEWPLPVSVISDRDLAWSKFEPISPVLSSQKL
jgi:dTDP-4-dehydrorhamnose 3,5-epimerase